MKFLPWMVVVVASALSFWAGTKWHANSAEPPQSSAKLSQIDATGASAANPAGNGKAGRNPAPATAAAAHSSVVGPPDSEEESRSPAERVRLAFQEKNEFRRLQLFHRALASMTAADAREVEGLFMENDKVGKYLNEPWFDQSAAINVAGQYVRDDPAGAKTSAATLPENAPVRQWVASHTQ